MVVGVAHENSDATNINPKTIDIKRFMVSSPEDQFTLFKQSSPNPSKLSLLVLRPAMKAARLEAFSLLYYRAFFCSMQ
jgi:hypothetical protein